MFTCNSTNHVSWSFEDKILPNNVYIRGKHHEVMAVEKIKVKNNGTYYCTTKDSGGKQHKIKAVLSVYGNGISSLNK